jgi:hypothetical protein
MHRQSTAVAICAHRTSVLQFGRRNVAMICNVAAEQQFNIPLPLGSASIAKRVKARLCAIAHDVRRVAVAIRCIAFRPACRRLKDRSL